jgi:hypothetical protein
MPIMPEPEREEDLPKIKKKIANLEKGISVFQEILHKGKVKKDGIETDKKMDDLESQLENL